MVRSGSSAVNGALLAWRAASSLSIMRAICRLPTSIVGGRYVVQAGEGASFGAFLAK
jgi:hypothetical protein